MRKAGLLFALAALTSLAGTCRADAFHAVVVDPIGNTPYTVYPVTSDMTNIGFATCSTAQTPGALGTGSYLGCWTGQNETGKALTSLTLVFSNTAALAGGAPDCSPDGGTLNGTPVDFFTAYNCTFNSKTQQYTLSYTGGMIPVGTQFTIAETADPADFPDDAIGLTVTPAATTPGAVPEPESMWLVATGMLGLGFRLARRTGGKRR